MPNAPDLKARYGEESGFALKIIDSRIALEVVDLFLRNPFLCETAHGIGRRIGESRTPLVARSLSRLAKAGVCETRAGGMTSHGDVTLGRMYMLSTRSPARDRIETFYRFVHENNHWDSLAAGLSRRAEKRRRLRRLGAVVGLAALAAAAGFLVFRAGRARESARLKDQAAQARLASGAPAVSLTYYDNGKLQSRTEYSNEVKNGKHEMWFENGARMLAGAYDHGQPDGEWTYWDLSGRKIMTRVFRNGQTVESMQYGGAKYPPPPTPAAGG